MNDSLKAVSADPDGLRARDVLAEEWEMVVGLEVHAELKTQTKLFSWSSNSFADEPNTNIDPVCLGLPGSLPVLNLQAVDLATYACVSLGSEIRPSQFSRKNYFYPDMPKNYQISQYDQPIGVGGALELPSGKVVGIVRAHLEEDTGKSTHRGGAGRIEGAEYSLIDYNRAGVPLLEIVSCPDIRSSAEAREYVIELRDTLVAVGASDGKMEEGSLRVDANVSVRRKGDPKLGTRCEIKNMNSLRSLVRAIDYEAERQVRLLSAGEAVPLETRHWDEVSARTLTLRTKEEETDYRYFPEPDLVLLNPDYGWIENVRSWVEGTGSGKPLLPRLRRERLAAATGRDTSDVALFVTRGQDELALDTIAAGADPAAVLKHLEHNLAALIVSREILTSTAAVLSHREQNLAAGSGKITPEAFAELIRMESEGELTSNQVKTTLAEMASSGKGPREVAAELGFESVTDSRLAAVLDGVIAEHPEEWTRFREGEEADRKRLQGFFVGQVMRLTKGQADGRAVAKQLRSRAGD